MAVAATTKQPHCPIFFCWEVGVHPETPVGYIKESELLEGAGLRRDSGHRPEEGFALLCFGVIGPHQARCLLVISWTVCVAPLPHVLLPSWACHSHN